MGRWWVTINGPENAHLRQGERGIGFLLILTITVAISLFIGVGVLAFFLLQEGAHPPDQTAKFLPDNTQIYFSLNFNPSNEQLRKLRDIFDRFREHPNFQDQIDDLLDEAEEETGIDVQEAVLPWLGPEVAVAVLDVVDSAEGVGVGGTPLVVAFFGTRDSQLSQEFLNDWIEYQTEQQALSFKEDEYRGFSTFTERDTLQHYAVTEDYIVFATDPDLLKETIDRIEDRDHAGSLYESGRFQEARDAAPSARFSMLYVDSESIWRDIRRLSSGQLSPELSDRIGDVVPDWATLTTTLLDKGVKLEVSSAGSQEDTDGEATVHSLMATRYLPADTLALVAFAVEPDLGALRQELREQRIDDLAPELYDILSFQFGLTIDPGATLSDVLDASLNRFREAVGLDLERDLLDWMTGEFSLALLPTDFKAVGDAPEDEAVQAAALVQFESDKRESVTEALGTIVEILGEKLGLVASPLSSGGAEGEFFDLEEFTSSSAYTPGYVVLNDHLLIATTRESLELAASLDDRQEDSLAQEADYVRLLKELSGTRNPLVYVNISGIREAVVAALDPADQTEYQEQVEPFVGPLRALLAAAETQNGVSRFSILLTID